MSNPTSKTGVERYGPACQFADDGTPEAYMFPRSNGAYVRFEDYDRLRAALHKIVDAERNRSPHACTSVEAMALTALDDVSLRPAVETSA